LLTLVTLRDPALAQAALFAQPRITTNNILTGDMVRKGKDAAPAVEEHPGGGHITVTAQQSRYALDAVDAPASKEVGQECSMKT
jgi:hypothetical protein